MTISPIKVRKESKKDFSEVVVALNALWEGLAEELDQWLAIDPGVMTSEASKHLQTLGGFSTSDLARKLDDFYAPPEEIPRWVGLNEDFDDWVNRYSRYIRKSFLRRRLPDFDKSLVHVS